MGTATKLSVSGLVAGFDGVEIHSANGCEPLPARSASQAAASLPPVALLLLCQPWQHVSVPAVCLLLLWCRASAL